jgi:hypothetical protein
LNIENYKVSLVSKPVPKFKIVDNGQRILSKDNIEELIVEPVQKGEKVANNGNYALLTPEQFSNMTDDELKDWYKKNKSRAKN